MAVEKLPLWRRWWTRAATAGIFTVIAWVTQVQLGETLPTAARISLLIAGALSALLAVLIPLRFARDQQILRISAETTAAIEVEESRLRTNAIHTPLARLVGEIAAATSVADKDRLRHRLRQMAVDFALTANKTAQLRACFFEYTDTPIKNFVCRIHAGRPDGPDGDFNESSDRGRAVLELVASKKARLVPDTSKEFVAGYDPAEADYRAFICAPVIAGEVVHGLLTLDCPAINSLSSNDKHEVHLIAMLLAAGLSA